MQNKKMRLKQIIVFFGMFLCFILIGTTPKTVWADTESSATAVTVGTINYDTLYMNVQKNNNTIVYYSLDKSTWYEVEADVNSNNEYVMDISWISTSSSTTIYFKGDTVKTILTVVLPAQNTSFKAVFNKVDGDFTFTNIGDSATFQWRNVTDYTWHTVSYEMDSDSYLEFLDTIDSYRVTATKIIIRTTSENGYGEDVGIRSSKEVTVSITARGSAPSLKVNIKSLVINTTASMEYYDEEKDLWIDCDKNMTVADLAPESLYSGAGTATTLLIRKAATSSSPYSKTTALVIPRQSGPPVIGDSTKDVTYYYEDSKLVLQFPKASSTVVYEYLISKDGTDIEDMSSVSWKTIKTSTLKKFSANSVPDGAIIYVRLAGTTANAAKYIDLVLPSQYATINVDR